MICRCKQSYLLKSHRCPREIIRAQLQPLSGGTPLGFPEALGAVDGDYHQLAMGNVPTHSHRIRACFSSNLDVREAWCILHVLGNAKRDAGKTDKTLCMCIGGLAKGDRWKTSITAGYFQLWQHMKMEWSALQKDFYFSNFTWTTTWIWAC